MLKASYNKREISDKIRNYKNMVSVPWKTEGGSGNRKNYHQFVKVLSIINAING